MYAAVMCPSCGRYRIIDLDSQSSGCPYCGIKAETKTLRIMYKGETAREVREVLTRATGPAPKVKERGNDPDPLSTLEYNYGKMKGPEKYVMLAQGLTQINGTFTQDDIETFDPGRSEKIIKMLMDDLSIIEERPGTYRSL